MSTSLLKQYHLLRRTTSPCSVSLPIAPWQTYMNQASDNWMRQPENAGKAMSIHTIPQLVSYAFPKALTPENITEGFRATGIYPFDRNIFPPHKFISCYSSDRPPPWKHGISDETTMSQAAINDAPGPWGVNKGKNAPIVVSANFSSDIEELSSGSSRVPRSSIPGTPLGAENVRPFGVYARQERKRLQRGRKGSHKET